jgi:hypothetical protein
VVDVLSPAVVAHISPPVVVVDVSPPAVEVHVRSPAIVAECPPTTAEYEVSFRFILF